ncbi:type III polyketide synthase [Protaetiibacter sp. SSC-01]|uniref:type III polyketide synthase n=1 Tax=Protaetiibacter sp. SSC-01 TaxID=2759943 RepID=UPI0016570676|nr:type III polyketide synthase [Protaetiibacter sp. SSC-01]QNO38231.1 type III polyketide synthase [Protaetiibacter sp. SSC-01]
MTARILAIETATPPAVLSQERARDVLLAQPGLSRLGSRLIATAFDSSGIDTRATVVESLVTGGDDELLEEGGRIRPASTGERNALYARHAAPLAVEAGGRALAAAGVDPSEVTHVVTASCTGFVSPGPDLALVQELGLRTGTARLHVGFMGCSAAFPALRTADAICRADPDAVVLIVCVELCTLHLKATDDPEQIVAMSLFADGAAAAVVAARPATRRSLAIEGFLTGVLPDSIDEMRWTIGDGGFLMRLSSRVPGIIGRSIREAIAPLVPEGADAVGGWAVHPGGRSIVDHVQDALELPDAAMRHSRGVLADHGNMSSPTVLFVLRRLLAEQSDGSVCAMAFGPGLTLEAARLRVEPPSRADGEAA